MAEAAILLYSIIATMCLFATIAECRAKGSGLNWAIAGGLALCLFWPSLIVIALVIRLRAARSS